AYSIYKNLKPGGKFVGINDNPGNAPDYYKKYKKYGFLKSGQKQRQEGSSIIYTFFKEDGSTYSLQSYYLSLETYEKVFLSVGFKDFRWKTLSISEKSKEKYNLDYWRIFLNHPPIIGIEAIRD
ncbi:MAG TPA: class I SAM-dependent methyltransferase, partial [Gammaproteobacteria bacterium]|nr:class I SAM-dependent methyltransferase [Gammaproteobacteria bacterium]